MTPLQQALLDYISAHLEAQGVAPGTEDITRRFRSRPDTAVVRALEGLASVGRLKRVEGRWEWMGPELQLHFELGNDAPAGLP